MRSDPDTTSAMTGPGSPFPSGTHEPPNHMATLLAGAPPAVANCPPATNADPYVASAETSPAIPSPRGAQELPDRFATWLKATPPAEENLPAAMSSPL